MLRGRARRGQEPPHDGSGGRVGDLAGGALRSGEVPRCRTSPTRSSRRTEITRLEELRLEAIETRVEADLRRGQGTELIGELTTLVDQRPTARAPGDPADAGALSAGRQAEALRAGERYRQRIGDELGLEPSPELRRLEEQILLHDQRLAPFSATAGTEAVTSPFKGLHAFQEADAADFFGRDRLVAEVITRLGAGTRLIALVGPSGSGKSSVARAGVVPALRKGSLPGSEQWLVASMVPGAHPIAELEAALLRSTLDAPSSLDAQLADPELGLLRAALRLLPHDASRLVLVIDQFEELFTLVADEDERQRFLANLVAAIDDPQGRVLVVITLPSGRVPPSAGLRRLRGATRLRCRERLAAHHRRARGGCGRAGSPPGRHRASPPCSPSC